MRNTAACLFLLLVLPLSAGCSLDVERITDGRSTYYLPIAGEHETNQCFLLLDAGTEGAARLTQLFTEQPELLRRMADCDGCDHLVCELVVVRRVEGENILCQVHLEREAADLRPTDTKRSSATTGPAAESEADEFTLIFSHHGEEVSDIQWATKPSG